ncbi:MAG: VCBS repeat-containing protein, partial [Bacteroidota bacterium]
MSPSFFQTRCFYLVLALVLSLAACQKKKDSSDDIVETAANPLFQLVDASKSGLQFNNKIEENFDNFFAQFNYVYNGGGVGIGDINQDGLADIYFTGNDVPNKLYLNKGNLQFEDITKKAGVE